MDGKRLFDVTVASVALLLTLPVQLVIALCILVSMGRPVLFLQSRPGLNGDLFTLIKFRSMDVRGEGLHCTSRVTALGRFLRRTSLDELPELVNVLKGDMSIVGPRPLLKEYLPLYNEQQRKRHNVKPGITGLAQVKGRNRISWSRKFRYDVWYAEHQSFLLDMKIVLLTFLAIFRSGEVDQYEFMTMEPFRGNDS